MLRTIALGTLALLTSVGCGDTISVRSQGRWNGYAPTPPTYSDARLALCGTWDPEPRAVDDESSVCATFELDAAKLAELPLPATLPIDADATFAARGITPVAFSARGDHSPAVLRAWVSILAFSAGSDHETTEHVVGSLRLRRVEPDRLAGSLLLDADGNLGGLSAEDLAAHFDLPFDAR